MHNILNACTFILYINCTKRINYVICKKKERATYINFNYYKEIHVDYAKREII